MRSHVTPQINRGAVRGPFRRLTLGAVVAAFVGGGAVDARGAEYSEELHQLVRAAVAKSEADTARGRITCLSRAWDAPGLLTVAWGPGGVREVGYFEEPDPASVKHPGPASRWARPHVLKTADLPPGPAALLRDLNGEGLGAATHWSEGVRVKTDSFRALYHASGKTLSVNRAHPNRYEMAWQVTPFRAWYRLGGPLHGLGGTEFSDVLDPEWEPVKRPPSEFLTERKGDEITVRRLFPHGTETRMTASMAVGGNIVRYERVAPDGRRGPFTRGEYEWERHPSGVYWVRSMRIAYANNYPDLADAPWTFEATYRDFDPDPPAPELTIASLKAPPGTRVSETLPDNSRKSYVLGGRKKPAPRANDEEELSELGKLLEKDSFADPGDRR